MSRRLKLGLAAALLFLVGTIGMTAWFYYTPHRAVSGVPDPEFSPYHKQVFEFLKVRDKYIPK